jgi:serine protease Do
MRAVELTMRAVATIALSGALLLGPAAPGTAQAPTVGDVFRKVLPSVAVIRATGSEVARGGGTVQFREVGSGVLISADGKVMTAAHVVHIMDEIMVEFLGSDPVRARVIASETGADLSLLQLESVPAAARPAVMADSSRVQIGDSVVIVGAPYGLSYSLTVGYISARHAPNSVYGTFPLAEFFQTDATINTGNSGGPMFNMQGEVVGIVSHIISKSGGSEGLGFVVTINTAKQLLLERRAVWGGLDMIPLTPDLTALLNVPQAGGVLIKNVAKGSPGEAAGLRPGTTPATIGGREIVLGGDILLAIAGIPLTDAGAMLRVREHLERVAPNTPFTVRVLRAGQVVDLEARLP